MSTQYEGLTKKFAFHTAGTEITGVEKVVLALKELMKTEGAKVSVTEKRETKKTTNVVVFDIYSGRKAGALMVEVGPEEVVAFMGQVTGNRALIRQSNVGVRHALTEANVRECYNKVLEGVVLTKGWSMDKAHQEFIEFLKAETGETKTFGAEGLSAVAILITGKKKSELTSVDRAGLLHQLYAVNIDPLIKNAIKNSGYDVEEFIKEAKNHHYTHYAARESKDGNGIFSLAKGTGLKAFQEKRNAKAVEEGVIEYDATRPHILINHSLPEKKAASGVVIAVRASNGPRADDEELKQAKAFLKSKNFPEGIIEKLGVKGAKEMAVSQGWATAE